MDKDYEYCDWQDTYRAMGCELPYDDDEENEDASDPAIVTLLGIQSPIAVIPQSNEQIPLQPDIIQPETMFSDIYEPSVALFGK